MRRIFTSLLVVGLLAVAVVGATRAFFSDTETSEGNVLQAGALDLKVDSEAHYNGLVCRPGEGQVNRWLEPLNSPVPDPVPDFYNQPCDGTWSETDLGAEHKFFNLADVKPGDEGENTISLHVYDNDAWGRFVISDVHDYDNTCTEPEDEEAEELCTVLVPENDGPGLGELAENITFYGWIDQGETLGFQNDEDAGEGDNIWDCGGLQDPREFNPNTLPEGGCNEPLIILPGDVDQDGETHDIWPALSAYRLALGDACDATDLDGNGQTDEDGDEIQEYGVCQGLADDGRLVGSTTYYFGLAWFIGNDIGNIIQTDSLEADLEFQVVQHRNNPTQAGF